MTCGGRIRKASFNIYVGEKLRDSRTAAALAENSHFITSGVTAAIFRRCPSMTEYRSDMPTFPRASVAHYNNVFRYRFMPVVYGDSFQDSTTGPKWLTPNTRLSGAYAPAGAVKNQFSCFANDEHMGLDVQQYLEPCAYQGAEQNNTKACACGHTSCLGTGPQTCCVRSNGEGVCDKTGAVWPTC